MTSKKSPSHPADPAQTLQDLANAKQEHSQQTPVWPGAREQAQPQHARARPIDESAPEEPAKTPPSKAGYERSDINKRHH